MEVCVLDLNSMRAQAVKALAHPTRLRIVDLLGSRTECSVSEIASALDEAQPTVSKHLSILRDAGFVQCRREGPGAYYSLSSACGTELLRCIDRVVLADVQARSEQLGSVAVDSGGTGFA